MTTMAWSLTKYIGVPYGMLCALRGTLPRLALAVVCAVLPLLLVPSPVSAHVALAAATPVPDTIIGQPPTRIVVRLDQSPDPGFSEVRVIDTSARAVAGGAAVSVPGDPNAMAVSIGPLPPGLYTVAWQALSPDGHVAKGNYSFTISASIGPGAPREPEPLGELRAASGAGSSVASGGDPTPLTVFVRWWRYLALGLLAGAVGLAVLVVRPALMGQGDGAAHWGRAVRLLHPFVWVGAILFVFAHLAALVVQAATLANIPVWEVRRVLLDRLLFDTVYGDVWRWTATVALLLLFGLLVGALPLWRVSRPPPLGIAASYGPRVAPLPPAPVPAMWPWRFALALVGLLAAALTLSSHAVESPAQPVLAVFANAAHLTAMGIWFGGLLVLLRILPPLLQPFDATARAGLLAAIVGRFSNVGLAAVGTLAATGVYAMTLHTTRSTLLTSSYGQALLLKHLAILPLVAVAAINLLVIKPRLPRLARARTWLVRLLRVEAALGLIVLLVTATLAQLPPANSGRGANAAAADPSLATTGAITPNAIPFGPGADLISGPQMTEMKDAPGVMAVIQVTSGRDGGAVHLNLVKPEGLPVEGQPIREEDLKNLIITPLEGVQRVTFTFVFVGADLGQRTVTLQKEDDGWYHAYGQFFPVKGLWRMQLAVRRAHVQDDTRLNFDFTSDPARFRQVPPTIPPAIVAPTEFVWPRLLPGAFAGLAAAVVGTLIVARRKGGEASAKRLPPRIWGAALLLTGVVVFGSFSTDRTPTSDLINPLVSDDATLALGEQVFVANCAMCHGAGGQGNGRLAAGMNPRPANLTTGRAASHTDGDAYWWISRGIPGTAMPAFTGSLDERETWAAIRYMRSLQGGAQP